MASQGYSCPLCWSTLLRTHRRLPADLCLQRECAKEARRIVYAAMSLGRKSGMRKGKAKPSKQPKAAKDPKTLLLTWGLHERCANDGVMPGSGGMPNKQVRTVGFQAASTAVCVLFGSASLQTMRTVTATPRSLC